MKTSQDIAATLILLLFVTTPGCLGSWDCGVSDVQEVNGLIDDQELVAYIRDCGATTDYTLNVSFKDPKLDIKKETGKIFFATHGNGIIIQKVAPDTVKIIYAATDVRRMKAKMKGIHFIYERNWKKISQEKSKFQP
jgi:hypothetical protein